MGVSTAQKKKKKGDEEDGMDPEFWMVTFGDLLSLLITFFVMLFAMSSLDDQVLSEAFLSTFAGGAGALSFGQATAVIPPNKAQPLIEKKQMGIREFYEYLQVSAKDKKILTSLEGLTEALLAADVTVKKRGPWFSLSIPNEEMFTAGSARIRPKVQKSLLVIADALRYSESDIVIEGHTDDTPISTPRYPSNWELSATRAYVVMDFFLGKTDMDKDRLRAVGYADNKPVTRNINEKFRKKNRRVEIVIRQGSEV